MAVMFRAADHCHRLLVTANSINRQMLARRFFIKNQKRTPDQKSGSIAAALDSDSDPLCSAGTTSMLALPTLVLDGYSPTTFGFIGAPKGHPTLNDWIEVFRKSLPTYKQHALKDASIDSSRRQEAVDQFCEEYNSLLDNLRDDPSAEVPGFEPMPLDCLSLCHYRDQMLYRLGFGDIFKQVKDEENIQALQLLSIVLSDIDTAGEVAAAEYTKAAARSAGSEVTTAVSPLSADAAAARARMELVLRGVFAGNIFDLGAAASAALFEDGGGCSSFAATREKLVPRPWAVDNIETMLDLRTAAPPFYKKAVLFVDNAGSDVVLGMIPLARELVKAGTKVIMAANEAPTVNDITAAELGPILKTAAEHDGILREAVSTGKLCVMSSGSHLPVIDLRKLSPELCAACEDIDLVVLEGMGRSIETNLNAKFTCDSWKLGMIKHPEVATCLEGRLYDVVCKFDRACSHEGPQEEAAQHGAEEAHVKEAQLQTA